MNIDYYPIIIGGKKSSGKSEYIDYQILKAYEPDSYKLFHFKEYNFDIITFLKGKLQVEGNFRNLDRILLNSKLINIDNDILKILYFDNIHLLNENNQLWLISNIRRLISEDFYIKHNLKIIVEGSLDPSKINGLNSPFIIPFFIPTYFTEQEMTRYLAGVSKISTDLEGIKLLYTFTNGEKHLIDQVLKNAEPNSKNDLSNAITEFIGGYKNPLVWSLLNSLYSIYNNYNFNIDNIINSVTNITAQWHDQVSSHLFFGGLIDTSESPYKIRNLNLIKAILIQAQLRVSKFNSILEAEVNFDLIPEEFQNGFYIRINELRRFIFLNELKDIYIGHIVEKSNSKIRLKGIFNYSSIIEMDYFIEDTRSPKDNSYFIHYSKINESGIFDFNSSTIFIATKLSPL